VGLLSSRQAQASVNALSAEPKTCLKQDKEHHNRYT
jgi:hypothetical protein